MEHPSRRDRRDEQQPEIVGEEKGRQRGDDAAEGEKRQEREEQPRQADAQQVVAELGVVGKLSGQPEGSLVERRADRMARDMSPRSRRCARLRDAQTCGISKYENAGVIRRSRRSPAARCRR